MFYPINSRLFGHNVEFSYEWKGITNIDPTLLELRLWNRQCWKGIIKILIENLLDVLSDIGVYMFSKIDTSYNILLLSEVCASLRYKFQKA